MLRRYWVILVLLLIGLVVLTSVSVERYMARDTIRGVTTEVFAQTIDDTLASTNARFDSANITVEDVEYIDDRIAAVKTSSSKDGLNIFVIFELKDSRVYLTNYSPSPFFVTDFDSSSDTTDRIINIVDSM